MKLIELETEEINNEFDYNELVNCLSEKVISLIDDEIKSLNENLRDIKLKLKSTKDLFNNSKQISEKETTELAKEKQLNKVLTKIDTLNKEGKIRGTTKVNIIKIIPNLNEYTFQQLSKLEEKLSIY